MVEINTNKYLTKAYLTNMQLNYSNGNNAWRDPYSAASNKNSQESNEWNGVSNENGQDESNTWANGGSNQRYPYRQGSGNYRSSGSKST